MSTDNKTDNKEVRVVTTTALAPIKPGYLTTEGWLSVSTAVVGSLLAAGVLGTGPVAIAAGAVMAGLAAVGYGQSRATVKAAHLAASAAGGGGEEE